MFLTSTDLSLEIFVYWQYSQKANKCQLHSEHITISNQNCDEGGVAMYGVTCFAMKPLVGESKATIQQHPGKSERTSSSLSLTFRSDSQE